MKNNDIKLIATDMDGTFLNDQHQYDQDLLRKVLASCKEKDIYFAAASGRALPVSYTHLTLPTTPYV